MKNGTLLDLLVLSKNFKSTMSIVSINEGGSINAISSLGKRKATSGISSYFLQEAAYGAHALIKATLQSPGKWRQVNFCVAQLFYDFAFH